MGQKRRRLALSCVACRRRKVKCDRNYPICQRCEKGGVGDSCLYVSHTGPETSTGLPTPEETHRPRGDSLLSWDEEAVEYEATSHRNEAAARKRPAPDHGTTEDETAAPVPSMDATGRRIAQLQAKVIDLETMVYSAGGKPWSNDAHLGLLNPLGPKMEDRQRNPWAETYKLTDQEKVTLRGKSFKTQYYGPSNTLAILLQFEDLAKFVREILGSLPALHNVKHSLSAIRTREKNADRQQHDISAEALLALVPVRAQADQLIYAYLDTIESLWRILHVPSFIKEYEAFWKEPEKATASFLVQLLLAMACVKTIVPGEEGYVGRSSAKREVASLWVHTCQFWFDSRSQKHAELVNYQVMLLLAIAKQMNGLKLKRFWIDTGTIIRKFMSAGFHREPTLLSSKISPVDCEMRRRLWYTALEIDLEQTISRGMMPTIGPLDWDTNPPRNIDDDDFDQHTGVLPEAKPRGEFTRSSHLCWAAETLPFRIELLSKINSIRFEFDLETILQYDYKIRKLFDQIPLKGWTKHAFANPRKGYIAGMTVEEFKAAGSLVPITKAQSTLNDFVSILHQSFSVTPEMRYEHFQSRVARRYSCVKSILLTNPHLSISDIDGSCTIDPRLHINAIQRRFFIVHSEGTYRSALSLAHSYANSAPSAMTGPFQLVVGGDNHLIGLVQAVVDMIEDHVMHLGMGFHAFWLTNAALSFMHSKQNPAVPRSTFSGAAADRVVKLHSKIMDGQLPHVRSMILPMDDAAGGTGSAGAAPSSITDAVGIAAGSSMAPMLGGDLASTDLPGFYAQETPFQWEDMDWNTLMNTDPTQFFGLPWDFPT